MTQIIALPDGTELAGDYRIERVLGAGGFGVTYLATDRTLSRKVSIKEYFPSDFASRGSDNVAAPKSKGTIDDYKWGLERFIDEAQTVARFKHPHIVQVFHVFRANETAYMVLDFVEGQSLKSWLKNLGRAPRQKELDAIVAPLLDALETIHKADVLHRDLAPDNIIIRSSGEPVLIDFGAARGELAAHSKTKTVSALVKPGYSPYEQYAETSKQQGPWTDIYAFAATLYHAIAGKRPPDSPSRMIKDEIQPARDAAVGSYRAGFLAGIDQGLQLQIESRPQSIAAWRGVLLAPAEKPAGIIPNVLGRVREKTEVRRKNEQEKRESEEIKQSAVPPPPDAPGPKGGLLDFVAALQKPAAKPVETPAPPPAAVPVRDKKTTKSKLVVPAAKEPAGKSKAETPPPLPVPAKRRRTRPNPDVSRSRPLMRSLRNKVIFAAMIGAAIIAFQDQIPRLLEVPPNASAITTGAVGESQPERKIAQSAEFKAHDTAINTVALSGDGRLIVTASQDGLVRVWTSDTFAKRGEFLLEGGAPTSLSVRNNRAVTAHRDGTVAIYDLDTGQRIYRFKRNDAPVWSVRFAGSEDAVAAAGHDWAVALWQTASETAPSTVLDGHSSAVQALAVSANGRWLASGGADRTVRLWNLEQGAIRRTYRNNADYISALSFSNDGSILAAGSLDGSVKLWSANSGRSIRTVTGSRARISSIAFAPNDDFLATASEDGTVRLRGLKRTRLYWSLDAAAPGATTIAFSGDGQKLLTGGQDGVVRLWSMPEAEVAHRD